MSTEQPLTVGDADVNQPTSDQPTATDNSTTQPTAPSGDVAPEPSPATKSAEEEDEPRPSAEDFGSILDQFEQEQSTLQEGEVVRGTVVGITERGVVIDFGYKSEGIVNQNEFMENGQLAVKPGDEVRVRVLEVDKDKRRIGLSIRRAAEAMPAAAASPAAADPAKKKKRPQLRGGLDF